MPLDAVKRLADGRVYMSQEAKAAGLIDGIGYHDGDVAQASSRNPGARAGRDVRAARGVYKPISIQ